MNQELTLRIILESPPPGVDFALQKGSGHNYEVIQKQRSGSKDLVFELIISVRENKSSELDFAGPFVQGPAQERFIYIDIGTSAGQGDSVWTRRLKVPLRDISQAIIKRLLADSSLVLQTKVPGTAKDGGPNCATVKPFPGWQVVSAAK
ncbi:MAG: DUF5990 family protein [Bacteroidota bacterium]